MKDDHKTKKPLVDELTELRSQNAALKKSESAEKYRSLVENIRDVIYELDSQGVVLYISPAIRDLLGYDSAEIVGKNFIELAHKDDLSSRAEWFSELRKGKESPSEYRDINKSGELRWARTKSRPIMEDGLFKGARGILIDVTEQRRAEEALRESEEKFRTIFDKASDGILIADAITKKFLQGNATICSMLGYTKEEIESLTVYDIHPPKEISHVLDEFEKQVKGEIALAEALPVLRRDGSIFYADIGTSPAIIGGLHCLFGIFRDITDRKRAEEALRESEERFRRIFEEGPFGMILANPDYTIVMANKAFCGLLGYSEQELAGQSIADITCEEDREKNRESSGQLFAGSIPLIRLEKRYVRKDGGIVWANITASAIHGKGGNVLYGLVIIEDLTGSKKAAEKIHMLHYYDDLTGLPNRIFHKELIKRAIEHAQRHKDIFALIYIGLDNLQRINDTLGYGIGDLLLKAVADRLTNSMRKSDYVARSAEDETGNVISRVGGDEFIILAHDIAQSHYAAKTSRRLLEELSAPYDLGGREVFITVSIGISLYPDDGTDVDDLLKNAEKAMRHTKSEGKNNYHFYSSSMHSSVLELLTLENDLHRALERNELVLYYQPKVDAATRMVKGMEALIRWKHPDRGLIPPLQFIPMAETSGLILPIGEFVIRTVCGQIKRWQEAGFRQMNIALNV